MTVIVARADDTFSQLLRDAGVEVLNLELITTKVLRDLNRFENLIAGIEGYDGVFFTSPVAADVFVGAVTTPVMTTAYALGRRAVARLEGAGFETRSAPGANTAEELIQAFGEDEFAGKRLLFVRGERSMRTIPEMLRGKAHVDEVAVYSTVEMAPSKEVFDDISMRLVSGEVDWICFFSPSAVEAFQKSFGKPRVGIAAIGKTTAMHATELGFRVEMTASRAANEVFAGELIERLKGKEIV